MLFGSSAVCGCAVPPPKNAFPCNKRAHFKETFINSKHQVPQDSNPTCIKKKSLKLRESKDKLIHLLHAPFGPLQSIFIAFLPQFTQALVVLLRVVSLGEKHL